MIKINLANLKQSGVGADAKGGKSSLFLPGSINLDRIKELPVKKILVPIVISLLASHAIDVYQEEELAKVETLIGKVNSENNKLQSELAKFKSYDAVKQSLDQDEISIKAKLETIQKLISDRNVPLKILTSISSAIPIDVWLTECKISETQIFLKGTALGFSQISDFMKALRESAYFASVDLLDTEQSKEKAGGESANFELNIKRR